MKSFALLQDLHFAEVHPFSEALLADQNQRILRFALKPHQSIAEHNSPHSALVLVVLSGSGVFMGANGQEDILVENDIVVYEPGETHAIRALDQGLIFIALLNGVKLNHPPVGLMC